jgi:hypothetical protein
MSLGVKRQWSHFVAFLIVDFNHLIELRIKNEIAEKNHKG